MGVSIVDFTTEVVLARDVLQTASDAVITSSVSLSLAANNFVALVAGIDQRLKALADREESLKLLDELITSRQKELDAREVKFNERKKRFLHLEKEVMEKESKFQDMEKKMSATTAKLPSIIHMSVGGHRFTTTRETLLQHKGSYFEHMLSTEYPQQLDNGDYFIDRDPTHFQAVLNFLRTPPIIPVVEGKEMLELKEEFQFYGIPFPLKLSEFLAYPSDTTSAFEGGNILPQSHQDTIKQWLPNRKFSLVYQATRDGFRETDFHRKCDNRGPTITIIQSKEGHIFGGYSPLPWDCSNTNKVHNDCFIFTLSNPHAIPPTKYSLKPGKIGTQCRSTSCAVFGSGDINVSANSNSNLTSFTSFPGSYVNTTEKGDTTFTGAYRFSSKEIEVYLVL